MFSFSVTDVKAFTAVASGDWSNSATWGGVAPGSNVSNQDIIIPIGITVNLDMDVTFGGLLNTFTVDGTLSNASTYGVTIDQGSFAGSGTVTIESLTFTSLFATMPFTGDLSVNSFRNTGAALTIGAIVSISDTFDLDAGSISIGTGANISPVGGSTIRIDEGTLTISGGVFNSGNSYNVLYVGASKSSGVELNSTTLNNVYVTLSSNAESVTLGNDMNVNGTLYLNRGTLDFSGDELTLNGNLVVVAGAMLDSDDASDLTVQGSTALTGGLIFAPGASLNDLMVNYGGSGNVKLLSALEINGNLWLQDGTLALENGASMTIVAGTTIYVQNGYLMANGGTFMGAAAYNVEYTGGGSTSSVELSGSGLTNVRLNMSSASAQLTMGSDAVIMGDFDLNTGKWNLNGYDLSLEGTLDRGINGSFIGNANSDLLLSFAAASTDTLMFDNSNQTLRKLTLDLTGASTIMLGSGLTLASELAMTNGKLDLGNYDLVVQSAAAITGYSDVDYIVTSGMGRLQMNVNSNAPFVTFPVGTATNYSPAMIQQTAAGTSGNFMVRTLNGFYSQGTTGTNFANFGSVVDRTWMIESAVGTTVNMNLKLAWTAASEVNGFDRTQAYISHYMSGSWDAYVAGSAMVGANNTYELTRNGVTSLSPFAVADTAIALNLVENLPVAEHFHAYPNPVRTTMYLEFADATKGYDFEIVDLTGKVLLQGEAHSGTHTVDVSSLSSGCYLLKASLSGDDQPTVKRFIKD